MKKKNNRPTSHAAACYLLRSKLRAFKSIKHAPPTTPLPPLLKNMLGHANMEATHKYLKKGIDPQSLLNNIGNFFPS